MVIDSYNVSASSSREYLYYESMTSKFTQTLSSAETDPFQSKAPSKAQSANAPPDEEDTFEKTKTDEVEQFLMEELEKHKTALENLKRAATKTTLASSPQEVKLSLLEQMLKALTGKDVKGTLMGKAGSTFETVPDERDMTELPKGEAAPVINHSGAQPQPMSPPIGANRRTLTQTLTAESYTYEAEAVSYSATGVINTADGQQISVDVSMNMSREFAQYTSVSVERNMEFLDPLVVNYAGTAASLSDETYSFDLNADGATEEISFAGEGSGFLALDKNRDGKINDGTELFGPQTGSGFAELRKYDKDNNGWIDENDDVYSKLSVWSKDKDGNDVMYTLKEADVGAIFLGDVATEFSLNDAQNNTKGIVRSTSFFLKDSGGAGTVSHIDLSL